jgi:hypothetical protein
VGAGALAGKIRATTKNKANIKAILFIILPPFLKDQVNRDPSRLSLFTSFHYNSVVN